MDKIISDIKNELVNQGLSESELARRAGFTQLKVNRLLNGITKRLDMAVIDKLRQTLGMASSPSAPSTGQGVGCGECLQIDNLDALILKSIAGFTPEEKRSIIEDIQKEKLLKELLKERAEREAA